MSINGWVINKNVIHIHNSGGGESWEVGKSQHGALGRKRKKKGVTKTKNIHKSHMKMYYFTSLLNNII